MLLLIAINATFIFSLVLLYNWLNGPLIVLLINVLI